VLEAVVKDVAEVVVGVVAVCVADELDVVGELV